METVKNPMDDSSMLHSATADATRKCVACREHKPCNEFSNRSLKRACANNELLLCKLCVQPSSTAGMSVEEAKQVVQAHQTKISKYRATNGQVTGKKHYPQKGNGAESAPRLSKKIKEVAFPRMGHVLEMRARDVFIYNPYELHGTTEIDLTGTPETSGLLLIAFYCKKDGVKGRSGTCAAIPQHM